jgi:hypothetical protein
LVFFLKETYQRHLESLLKDIKKCFVSPFDLVKIELYESNHERIMIGRVYHSLKTNFAGLKTSRSILFSTEFGSLLYSRELKGSFKVYSDIHFTQKIKELINY